MAVKIEISGFDTLEKMFDDAAKAALPIAAAALYEGAGTVADEISAAVDNIQTEPYRYRKEGDPPRLPSPKEKEALQAAHVAGITKFTKDGTTVETLVGMSQSGYAQIGKRTVPVPVIARSIESGTTFMRKQPFLREAINRAKRPAEAKIMASIDKRFKALTSKYK